MKLLKIASSKMIPVLKKVNVTLLNVMNAGMEIFILTTMEAEVVILAAGVMILEAGVMILEVGVMILEAGVMILEAGVMILEAGAAVVVTIMTIVEVEVVDSFSKCHIISEINKSDNSMIFKFFKKFKILNLQF